MINIIFYYKIYKESSNPESINNELISPQFCEILFGGCLTKNLITNQPSNMKIDIYSITLKIKWTLS